MELSPGAGRPEWVPSNGWLEPLFGGAPGRAVAQARCPPGFPWVAVAGVTFLPGPLRAASSVPPAPSGGSLGRKQCAFSTPGSGSQQFGTVWLAASTGFLWHFIGKGGDISFSWVGGAVMQTPALLIRQMNIHDSGNLYQPDFPEGGSFSSLPLSLFLSPSLLPSSLESWSTAIFNLQIRSYLACLLGGRHWGGDAGDGNSGGSLCSLTLGF